MTSNRLCDKYFAVVSLHMLHAIKELTMSCDSGFGD